MQSFLEYATNYKKLIKVFAHIAAFLNRLLQKEQTYKWSLDCDAAFEALKQAFDKLVTLACPDFKRTLTDDTNARNYGIGEVHISKHD